MVRVIVAASGLQGVLRDTEYVRAAGRTHNPWWGLATAVQGTVYSMLGEFEIARHRLVEGMASVSAPVFEAGGLAHLALLDLHAGDVGAADRHAARGLAIAERHHLEAIVPAVVVFAVGSLVAAKQGREAEARQHVTASRRILARLGDLSPRTALLCYLLVAQSAMAVGDLQLARSLATEARRARRSETEATFLNTQLDELSSQLEHGSTEGTLEIAPLTPAELHVLAYLPTHLSHQEIAEALFISRNTAKSHAVAIYRKLGVGSRSEAVQAAQRLGLLER
jgi:LuxR family maltose regulon positive regulatory protein